MSEPQSEWELDQEEEREVAAMLETIEAKEAVWRAALAYLFDYDDGRHTANALAQLRAKARALHDLRQRDQHAMRSGPGGSETVALDAADLPSGVRIVGTLTVTSQSKASDAPS